MDGKQLIKALRAGDRVYGTAIYSPSPIWPRVVKNLDLDMVFIDTEHTPHDRNTVSWLCQSYSALNLAPVVRIPSPDPYLAQMVLDGGATGVIAPYVESVDQVKALGGAVKFGPLKGDKLQAFLDGSAELEPELADYLAKRNAHKALIINIESVPALDRLDDILSVPYVDAVLIGPHDLSCSLGVPEQYDHPVFDKAIRKIITTSRNHNVGIGIHHNFTHHEIEWVKAGANLVMHSSDISAFNRALTAEFKTIRDGIDDEGNIQDENVHF
jgi:staphyloferrin B biosynthesis citrate synthase